MAAEQRVFFSALHGLRGIMALWVVMLHASPQGLNALVFPNYGYLGVDVFFVLSGFVLMHTHSADLATPEIRAAAAFWRARFWRVYPVYFVSVLLSILAFWLTFGVLPSALRIAESFANLEQWAARGIGMNWPSWSLGVEWLGYFALPLLAPFLLRLNRTGLLLFIVTMMLLAAATPGLIDEGWNARAGLPAVARMFTEFSIGCALNRLPPGPALRRNCDLLATIAGGAALILIMTRHISAVPYIFVVMIYGIAAADKWVFRLLSSRVAVFLGKISYSLYITSTFTQRIVVMIFGAPRGMADRIFSTIALYCAVIALAWLLCTFVEEPMRRAARTRARRPVPAAS
jgi:peptidoglycan/LPS O-acetylase OafA/YrhL